MIALDSTSNNGSMRQPGGSSDSFSWNHTCTGLQLILIVGVSTIISSVSSMTVTYNGVSMTQIRSDASGSYQGHTNMFRLLNPDIGTNIINVSIVAGGAPAQINGVTAGAISLSGVKQSTPTSGGTNCQTTQAPVGLSVTPSVANSWVIDCLGDFNSLASPATYSPSPQTIMFNNIANAGQQQGGMSYYGPFSTTTSIGWSPLQNGQWAYSAVLIRPEMRPNFFPFFFT